MAYTSIRGRKPIERASKISHSNIIANDSVKQFLAECAVPHPAEGNTVDALLKDVPPAPDQPIQAIVAVDGSMREVAVREDFPSAAITFFAFGPLLFKLEALRSLDHQPFIAPEDLAKLKNIQRYSLVLPTRNISFRGLTLRDSTRLALHEFFSARHSGEDPLYTTLRWILFRGWQTGGGKQWEIPRCPNYDCGQERIVVTPSSTDSIPCPGCGKSVYLVDACRLHERIDEEQGASGISSYVLTLLEQIVLVHVIRQIWEMKPSLLREVLFIKDGPLACFGQTAPLSTPLREMAAFLGDQPNPGDPSTRLCLLNLAGLEKSGAFVEHAVMIDEFLRPGTVLPMTNDYVYRYIVPGDPSSADPYGFNTYWGSKLIFKATDGNCYVATVPTAEGFKPSPGYGDYLNLTYVLSVLSELRCSMYDNALIPVALANRLVSLSDVPSSRILETFARDSVSRG
jgi:hypothetical protein